MKLIKSTEDACEIFRSVARAGKSLGIEFGADMDASVNRVIYKFCEHWHRGQSSTLYNMMSAMRIRGDVVLDETEEEMYNALTLEYTGCDLLAIKTWNNQARAAYALQALKAYVEAKNEVLDEFDIENLVTDLLHLKAEILDGDHESDSIHGILEDAFSSFAAERKPIDEMEKTDMHEVDIIQQGDLTQWLGEMEREVKWERPKVTP